ncbi:MAG TPA: GDSL-type esterase/lipase family protein [Polyangiaceae bacterium]|nr:GDSL-type esterase/lipase family protein [Polyangiaceae bacterium]
MSKSSQLPLSSLILLVVGALVGAGCSGNGEEARPSSESARAGASPSTTLQPASGGAPSATSDSRGMIQGGASFSSEVGASSGGITAPGGGLTAVGGGSTETASAPQGGKSASTADTSSTRGGSRPTSTKSTQSAPAVGGARSSSTKATGGTVATETSAGGKSAGGTKAAGGATTGSKASTGGAQGGGGPSSGGAATTTFPVGSGKPTVYIAGDSTAQTYATNASGQQGWGQRISEFFTTEVTFVNKSIGGRSSKSFIDEGRLDEILAIIKQGDYLFAQWGINDRYQSDSARYTDPATTFRTYLKQYIDGARKKNAIPVLLTPTPRHQYVNGVFENGFAAYCDAIKAVGKETNTPVIDVQTKALAYYTSIGEDVVSSKIILDVLHFKAEGAYQMARIVADGVHESILPISKFVIESKLAP